MRKSLPSIPSILCMNYGNIYTGDNNFDAKHVERNLREMWSLGIRKVRFGGTSPQYIQQARGDFVGVAAQMLLAKQMGFYIENGTTHLQGVDATLTSTNWTTYHDYAVSFAVALYAVGLDTFMIGNELYTGHIDGTTIANLDALYTLMVQLATDIHDVCPNIKVVYNGRALGGTDGEWNNWITWINAHGAIPAYMQLGFNIYGGSSLDAVIFQSQVNSIVSLGGYVSEWNLSHDWNYGYSWDKVPYSEEIQYSQTKERLKILKNANIDSFFWCWKNHNKNAAGSWNNWGVYTNNGTPTYIDNSFDKRPSYFALFPKRRYRGGNKRSLFLDGNHYAETGIVPAATGISIGFWHKRHRYFTSNAEHIITNSYPGDGNINQFRLFHDSNSKNLVFNTFSSGSGGYNVVSLYKVGVWNHIAIIISSAGAFLFINGEQVGGSISGNMGTPTRTIAIGSRATDYAVKGQFCIDRLTIQNTPTPWTTAQIRNLMRHDTKPPGSSYYYFNHDGRDSSGNGNHLTFSAATISYSLNVPEVH